MINKVILVGNVGKEVKEYHGATTFSVATTETYKDKDGEKQRQTEWHNVVCFGKLAEFVAKYITTGRVVYVEGKIKTEKFESNGQTKYTTRIYANSVQALADKSAGKPAQTEQESNDSPDGDLPF